MSEEDCYSNKQQEIKEILEDYDHAHQLIGPRFKWEDFIKENTKELLAFDSSMKTMLQLLKELCHNEISPQELTSFFIDSKKNREKYQPLMTKSKNLETNFNGNGNFIRKKDSFVFETQEAELDVGSVQ